VDVFVGIHPNAVLYRRSGCLCLETDKRLGTLKVISKWGRFDRMRQLAIKGLQKIHVAVEESVVTFSELYEFTL
jgi:hypothetical protein